MIAAGSFNRRVTLFQQIETRNSVAETVSSWTTLASVWGQRSQLLLREVNRMAGTGSDADAKFLIRYRQDVTVDMEIACEGHRYAIVAVDEIGNREALSLIVRAAA